MAGVRVAALPGGHRRDDECLRDAERAGAELLAAAAGDGAGRHAAEDSRKDKLENKSSVGGRAGMRSMLGTLSAIGIQTSDHTGHRAFRRQPDAGIRGAGGAADPRAETEAGFPRTRRSS